MKFGLVGWSVVSPAGDPALRWNPGSTEPSVSQMAPLICALDRICCLLGQDGGTASCFVAFHMRKMRRSGTIFASGKQHFLATTSRRPLLPHWLELRLVGRLARSSGPCCHTRGSYRKGPCLSSVLLTEVSVPAAASHFSWEDSTFSRPFWLSEPRVRLAWEEWGAGREGAGAVTVLWGPEQTGDWRHQEPWVNFGTSQAAAW